MIVSESSLDALLARVQKPARYVGREWNSVAKQWDDVEATLVLAYPDVYEIGMSNLGLGLLYDVVNRDPRYLAERVFSPWVDMESAMRADGIALHSLESRHLVRDFDVFGISLQYELTYTNALSLLDLAGLPVWSSERTADMPLVIAGGSCALNPEPMAPFFDLFVIGEGEEVIVQILAAVAQSKRRRGATSAHRRDDLLRELAAIEGVYVPRLYDVRFAPDGGIMAIEPRDGAPSRVRKRVMSVLGPVPERPIVPTIAPVHDRAMVEIQRGCGRGCRFCQAGMIYRPVRERPAQETIESVHRVLASTGYDEVGLVSLSSSDHSGIADIVRGVMGRESRQPVAVSLPSLRIDSFSVELAQLIEGHRKTGFTFAPEAGSQRLRDVINKGVTEDDLLRTADAAFASGWRRIKLYFMLGLPTETDADVREIARLLARLRDMGRRRHRKIDLGVSIATFVPKPHTPFQWEPLADKETIIHRQQIIRDAVRWREAHLSWPEWEATWLEAVLCRGDRRLAAVVHAAWLSGARFDAWSEGFSPALWSKAFAKAGVDLAHYASRARDTGELLPWSMVDIGVSPSFLAEERTRAYAGSLSPGCRDTCLGCGVSLAYAAQRSSAGRDSWVCR